MRALLLAAALLEALIGPPAQADETAARPSPAGFDHRSLSMVYAELVLATRPHTQSPFLPIQASGPVSCKQVQATCCCKHGPMTEKSWFCTSQSECEGRWSGVCVERFEPATMSEANNNHCNQ